MNSNTSLAAEGSVGILKLEGCQKIEHTDDTWKYPILNGCDNVTKGCRNRS